jgi:hypothetical protein
MLALHTTYRRNHLNSQEALRLQEDKWSPDKQVEFAPVTLHQLTERFAYREPEINPSFREFLRAATD